MPYALRLMPYALCLILGCQNGPFGKPQSRIPQPFANGTPTFEQIQQTVNNNTHRIRSMQSEDASVTVSSVSPVSMRSSFMLERPKRVRLKGGVSSLTGGQEYDIGCNDDVFWIWFRRDPNQALYSAKLSQWAASPQKQKIPLDPSWLPEAFGLVEFRADESHEGPFRAPDGNYEVHTRRNTPEGLIVRKVRIDSKTGVVLQQEFESAAGAIVASRMSGHVFDPQSGIVYPKSIEIRSPNIEGTVHINLGNVQFNTIDPSYGLAYFTKPTYENFREVDLCYPVLNSPPLAPQQEYIQEYPLYRSVDASRTIIR